MAGLGKELLSAALDKFEDEAKKRFGDTDAYKESQEKTFGLSKEQLGDIIDKMGDVFSEFMKCKKSGEGADSDTAQKLVKKLKDYISDNFYNCTDEILSGLGKMYSGDDRFKKNIDKVGEGTAEFISEAIKNYCKKN